LNWEELGHEKAGNRGIVRKIKGESYGQRSKGQTFSSKAVSSIQDRKEVGEDLLQAGFVLLKNTTPKQC